MLDSSTGPGPDHIILVEADGDTWFLQGADHAHALLSGDGPYPTPVYHIGFPSRRALGRFLAPHSVTAADLWQINPAFIAPLTQAGVLFPLPTPEAL